MTASAIRLADLGMPDQAEALLAQGAIRSGMTPAQIDRVQGTVAVARRGLAAAEKEAALAVVREAKAAQDAQRKVNADVALRAKNGDATASEIAQARSASAALGLDPAEVTALEYAEEDSTQGRVFRGLTTPQLEDEAEALRVVQRAGQIDAENERRLGRLDEAIGARDDETSTDLKDLDPAQQLDRLAQEPMARRLRLAKSIGGDKVALIAGLPPRTRELALKGQRTRADLPDAFMPIDDGGTPDNKKDDKTVAKLADAKFLALIGPELSRSLLASGQYETAREAALNYFVGNQVQAGNAGRWTDQGFAAATAYVFGARPRPGGGFQGGLARINGAMTELPDHWNRAEFDKRLARYDWSGAFYTDGSPVEKADVRANFHLVLLGRDAAGDWRYRVENKDGVWLRKKDGSPFLLPVPDSPRGGR